MPITIKHRSSGAGLIEVMVAVLILAIGLLGILSMQARSVQYNQQAYLYSQATILAWDISERMKANAAVADSYLINFGATTSAAVDCLSAACGPEQLAEWDLNDWMESVEALLPQGDAEISGTASGTGTVYTVTIELDVERGEGELDQVQVEFSL